MIDVFDDFLRKRGVQCDDSIRHEWNQLQQNVILQRHDRHSKDAIDGWGNVSKQTRLESLADLPQSVVRPLAGVPTTFSTPRSRNRFNAV
jgi:hypothetical protein